MECSEQLHGVELNAPMDTRTGNEVLRQMSHLKAKRRGLVILQFM